MESLELRQRPLPYTAIAVGLAFALWWMPAPARRYDLLAGAAALGAVLIGLAWARPRWPRVVDIALPLGFIGLAAVLRESAGGGVSGFAGLFLLPVLWLALAGRRRELTVALAAMATALFVPIIAVGGVNYPSSGWRGAVVLLAVAACAGAAIQALVAQARRYAGDARARANELQHANAELEKRNRLAGDFVALAAHELRTPVTSIYGFASTYERLAETLAPEQAKVFRQTIADEALRLGRLVEQLLDLSRLEAHAIEINPVRLNVREKVEALLPLTAGEWEGEIRVDISPDLEANLDEQAFERVVSNLISNAIRYGRAPITVAAEQRDRHFRLTVEDRGDGIPDHFMPTLFDRFTRSSEARDKSAGTGLGLSIARSYARAHNGDLTYEHADPSGARFQLVLANQPRQVRTTD